MVASTNGNRNDYNNGLSNGLNNGQVSPRPVPIVSSAGPIQLSAKNQKIINQLIRASSQKKLIRPGSSLPAQPTGPIAANSAANTAARRLAPSAIQPGHTMSPSYAQPLVTQQANFSPAFTANVQRSPGASIQPVNQAQVNQAQVNQAQSLQQSIQQYREAIHASPRSAELYRGLARLLEKKQAATGGG